MKSADKPEFVKLLNLCYSTVLKPLPPLESIQLWLTLLEPYSIEQVRVALSTHMRESNFAPVPADVVKRMPKESNGHPEANEAWAIALRSRDERDTVVWTNETAQAFSIAKSVLDEGDEVGARMAFKEAYARLVEAARARGAKPEWVMSLGHDAQRRDQVLSEAVTAGRLLLANVAGVVPALAAPAETSDMLSVETNLAKMKTIVAGIESARARAAIERSRAARAEQDRLDEAKRETARRVAEYEASHA
jgi:hypothetical protein